jgi:hypothetical protein
MQMSDDFDGRILQLLSGMYKIAVDACYVLRRSKWKRRLHLQKQIAEQYLNPKPQTYPFH